MFKFEASEANKIGSLFFTNDQFFWESNDEIRHYGQTLVMLYNWYYSSRNNSFATAYYTNDKNPRYAKDKNHVYLGGEILKNANANKFHYDEKKFSCTNAYQCLLTSD